MQAAQPTRDDMKIVKSHEATNLARLTFNGIGDDAAEPGVAPVVESRRSTVHLEVVVKNKIDGPSFHVRNPFDDSVIGSVPQRSAAYVSAMISKICTYDAHLTAWQRYDILIRFCELLSAHREEFKTLISRESGKTLNDANLEIDLALQAFNLSAEEAKRINGEVIPLDDFAAQASSHAYVVREPIGPIVAITPFSDPLNVVAHKVGAALAANNAIIVKPSEHTPLTAVKMAELLYRAGVPTNMLQIVTGKPREIVETFALDSRIRKLTFTGSVAVGKAICQISSMKHLSMELGGNDPMIILEDADLDAALPIAIDGAFGNNGERCTSIKRFIIVESVADTFISSFVRATRKLSVGDQLDPNTNIGPLISEAAAETIRQRIYASVLQGATLLFGGERQAALLTPTVLDSVSVEMPIVKEETFGPVASFIRVANLNEAITVANQTEFALQASVFTNNLAAAKQAIAQINAGAVLINRSPGFRAEHLPSGGGGGGDSGIGRQGIKYAIAAMTHFKTIVM